MLSTMMDYPLVLDRILDRAAAVFPRVELVSRRPDRSLARHTYTDLHKRAYALAAGLQRSGLREGDRVATLMWNHHAHLEAYFGVPLAGGVYHTLNLRLSPDELTGIATHAGDRFLIVDDVLLPLYLSFAEKVPFEKVWVVSANPSLELPPGVTLYEDLLAGGSADLKRLPDDEKRAAGLCYTSGTTGKPKGVLYSHRTLVLHSLGAALGDVLDIRQADTILPIVPMFHANAWGIPIAATMVGAKQVFPGPYLDAPSLLELFAGERVTMSGGVPTVGLAIMAELEKNPDKWTGKLVPHMRMIMGGSAAPESLIRSFDARGIRIVHAWGMTEMSPLGTVAYVKASLKDLPEDRMYAQRATQGVPAPFIDIRARNEDGLVPWDGKTPGELEVRGAWVAASYFQSDEGKDRWTDDGWFKTGDVVTIDDEGYVRITDRAKDLVKSGGEWISTVALENALMGHPAVREAAVIAVPHPKWTERPLAVVVFKEGQRATDEELRAHLAPGFASWALPDGYVERTEIPRTSTGKFLKTKLREELKDWKKPA
jgi:fatty-acyl-CoA synthase